MQDVQVTEILFEKEKPLSIIFHITCFISMNIITFMYIIIYM